VQRCDLATVPASTERSDGTADHTSATRPRFGGPRRPTSGVDVKEVAAFVNR